MQGLKVGIPLLSWMLDYRNEKKSKGKKSKRKIRGRQGVREEGSGASPLHQCSGEECVYV